MVLHFSNFPILPLPFLPRKKYVCFLLPYVTDILQIKNFSDGSIIKWYILWGN